MYTLDRKAARDILISELGYKPEEADLYLDEYPILHDQLAEAVQAWLEDRRVLKVEVENISIKQVMKIHNCHFLNAVSDLNELLIQDLDAEGKKALITFLQTPMPRA